MTTTTTWKNASGRSPRARPRKSCEERQWCEYNTSENNTATANVMSTKKRHQREHERDGSRTAAVRAACGTKKIDRGAKLARVRTSRMHGARRPCRARADIAERRSHA